MADTSRITPSTPESTREDPEALPPSPPKELSRPILSRLVSLVRRYPFLSTAFVYLSFAALIAGLCGRSVGRGARPPVAPLPHDLAGIALMGRSYEVDMISQTLSIEWEVVGCGGYGRPTVPFPRGKFAGCYLLDRAVDIYLNNGSKPTFSYDPAIFPLFQPDQEAGSEDYEPLYVHSLNVFDVVHSLDFVARDTVPFDTYSLGALVFVIEKATNKCVPIVAFAAGEGPANFAVSSFQVETRSKYTYDSGTGPATVEVTSRVIQITVKRSQIAKAFTMCLFIVSTALAVGSAYITFLVFFEEEGVDRAVLLLPVTIILTIPALRDLYPGSPPFGIYLDTFGFFFQMMVVAVCSMILLYKVAQPSTQVRRASHDSGKGYISKILNLVFLKRSGSAT